MKTYVHKDKNHRWWARVEVGDFGEETIASRCAQKGITTALVARDIIAPGAPVPIRFNSLEGDWSLYSTIDVYRPGTTRTGSRGAHEVVEGDVVRALLTSGHYAAHREYRVVEVREDYYGLREPRITVFGRSRLRGYDCRFQMRLGTYEIVASATPVPTTDPVATIPADGVPRIGDHVRITRENRYHSIYGRVYEVREVHTRWNGTHQLGVRGWSNQGFTSEWTVGYQAWELTTDPIDPIDHR